MSDPLWRWPAHQLTAAIRAGAVSAREVATSTLERVQAVNPVLNAIVDLLPDEALAAADAADAARRRGDALGPLHGVPVTVKVNVDLRGRATTNGVVAFKDNIATDDSPVVANLRRAGAVVIGRTNTPAFSVRWFTDNALHGRTLNPWSRGHTPAGPAAGHRQRWPPAWAPSPMATIWPARCATRPTAPACWACGRPSGACRPTCPAPRMSGHCPWP